MTEPDETPRNTWDVFKSWHNAQFWRDLYGRVLSTIIVAVLVALSTTVAGLTTPATFAKFLLALVIGSAAGSVVGFLITIPMRRRTRKNKLIVAEWEIHKRSTPPP